MRIGIIGSGGAGTTAAWLLEQDHDVTLFERNAVLGGHAHTTDVETPNRVYACDDGFAWFSNRMYPLLLRLLALHDVATEPVPMGITFTNRTLGLSLAMPPNTPGRLWQLLREPRRLRYLLGMDHAIRQGLPVVRSHEDQQTLRGFVDGLRLREDVRAEFVQPFLFGIWGGPWERSGDFSAYPVLKYPVLHRPTQLRRVQWMQVADGARRYIDAVAATMTRAQVLRDTPVQGLCRLAVEADGAWQLVDGAGTSHVFDQVIVATGVRDAQRLLADVDGVAAQQDALAGFETYIARVATHRDPSFMPPDRKDWTAVHVDYDGRSARQTSWIGWADGAEVFTSYISDREPAHIEHLSHFCLPLVSPAHFRAQKRVAALQGDAGLHFCGDWTQDIGSHEDAVRSAVDAARRIAGSDGQRFTALTAGTPSARTLATS